MTTSTDGGTYTYDANGNLTVIVGVSTPVTMSYDMENRMKLHNDNGSLSTYTYDGDGMKRFENSGTPTTLIWDGGDYLGAKV